MSDLNELKKQAGQAVKAEFQRLTLPGEKSKKVTTKFRLEAILASGAKVAIGCGDVKGGRPPGAFALYWMCSMESGPVQDIMNSAGLGSEPSYVFTLTSHGMPEGSHFEVHPGSDVARIAADIAAAVRTHVLPLIEGFEAAPERALDAVLQGKAGAVRNPFTTCVILMHLAGRTSRLEEIISTAKTAKDFYDFKNESFARDHIVRPLADWFAKKS